MIGAFLASPLRAGRVLAAVFTLAAMWEGAFAQDAIPPAIGGYCPVSYQTQSKAVKGDEKFQSTHEGQRYYFASEDAKKLFDANPTKYAPQFAGLCATALGGSYGNRLPSDPNVFIVADGKLYLFSSERAKRAYETDPPKYTRQGEERFNVAAFDGYCPVSFQTVSQATKGQPQFRAVYNGMVFHLASAEARDTFVKEPARFVPQYRGYCAAAISTNRRYPGDPRLFAVVDNKTYFLFDEKAKATFEADPKTIISQADEKWKTLKDMEKGP